MTRHPRLDAWNISALKTVSSYEPMTLSQIDIRRAGVALFLVTIAVNAVIGIVALLSGEFDETDGKILITSLSVSAGAILGLTNLAALERSIYRPVPIAGAAAAVLGFILLIASAWEDFDTEPLGKLSATLIFFSIAATHATLLTVARPARRYLWVLVTAYLLAFGLAIGLTIGIWSEDVGGNFWRPVGVVSILLAFFTVASPVLRRTSREADSEREAQAPTVRYCPNCCRRLRAPDEAP